MTDPKPLKDSLQDILTRNPTVTQLPVRPAPEVDDYDRQEQIRLAAEYADKHIPARYADALADDSTVVTWIRQLLDQAIADSIGRVMCTVQTGPSLLILGPTGVGKTHQAYGALRILSKSGARCHWKAITAADLYARLRPRHGVDHETEFRSIADAPLLLVDDLGAAKTSEWVEEVNYRLVNWRYERILPTLFTSNVPPKELSNSLGERVSSRLIEMADRVVLQGSDRRRIGA